MAIAEHSCVCVCLFVCTRVLYVCICMFICKFVCMCVHTCVYLFVCVYYRYTDKQIPITNMLAIRITDSNVDTNICFSVFYLFPTLNNYCHSNMSFKFLNQLRT